MLIKKIQYLTVILFLVFPLYSYGEWSAVVTSDALNIRQEANVKSPVVHTLKQDNELILHEEFDNGWASITYTENDLSYTGFVSQKYLKKGDEIILEIEGFSTSNKIIFL